MKALTISQPYATLIASGEKWIENRTWPTSYRGLLAIHAGKGSQYLDKYELAMYPTGCVLAVAKLVACERLSLIEQSSRNCPDTYINGTSRTWLSAFQHEHAEGPWCWILEDVRKLEVPAPVKGAQGLWVIDSATILAATSKVKSETVATVVDMGTAQGVLF